MPLSYSDRFDSLIQYWCQERKFPLDWRWIKAQIKVESNFNPQAMSNAGAFGLMQLMPATASWLKVNPFHLEENLEGGIRYMVYLLDRLKEISDEQERLKFALAAYNGGMGYIKEAINLAQSHSKEWQHWHYTKYYLTQVEVNGKTPYYNQIWEYVTKVFEAYSHITGYRLVFMAHGVRVESRG